LTSVSLLYCVYCAVRVLPLLIGVSGGCRLGNGPDDLPPRAIDECIASGAVADFSAFWCARLSARSPSVWRDPAIDGNALQYHTAIGIESPLSNHYLHYHPRRIPMATIVIIIIIIVVITFIARILIFSCSITITASKRYSNHPHLGSAAVPRRSREHAPGARRRRRQSGLRPWPQPRSPRPLSSTSCTPRW
jgi:hypothetical protein